MNIFKVLHRRSSVRDISVSWTCFCKSKKDGHKIRILTQSQSEDMGVELISRSFFFSSLNQQCPLVDVHEQSYGTRTTYESSHTENGAASRADGRMLREKGKDMWIFTPPFSWKLLFHLMPQASAFMMCWIQNRFWQCSPQNQPFLGMCLCSANQSKECGRREVRSDCIKLFSLGDSTRGAPCQPPNSLKADQLLDVT